MEINGLEVTGKDFEIIDTDSAHVHLGGCIRLVWLKDTEFSTVEELQTAVEALIF